MTGNAAASPDEEDSIRGGGGMQRPQRQNGGDWAPPAGAGPAGAEPNAVSGLPAEGAAGVGGGRAGGGKGGNALKARFLASEAFQPLYDDAYADLYQQLYDSGTAADLLSQIAAVVPSTDGLTQVQLVEQTDALRTFIQDRTEAPKDQV
jgi:hypothetical protein